MADEFQTDIVRFMCKVPAVPIGGFAGLIGGLVYTPHIAFLPFTTLAGMWAGAKLCDEIIE